MRVRSLMTCAAAGAMLVAPCVATAQSYQNFDYALDQVAQADSRNWIYANSYDQGSMRNAQVIAQSNDGRRLLIKGYYTYNRGTRSHIVVRIVDNAVTCISYDTSFSNCTLNGTEAGTGTYVAGAIVIALVAAAASSSDNSGNGRNNGSYSQPRSNSYDDPYYRQRNQPAPAPSPTPAPRSYGLYGDCPQPGAGYGC